MKLSIALCTYNGAAYLREQLESIAVQTRIPDELVISDDLSTDGTLKIIDEFASAGAFAVRRSVNESNLGVTKNFEKAVSLCRGDVIVLSHQDDCWRPDKLESIERVFLSRPGVGLVFSNAELIDETRNPYPDTLFDRLHFNDRKQRSVRTGRALDVLLRQPLVCGATMAFRANFKSLLLPFPSDGPLIHDGWIALLISAVAEIDFIDRPLLQYRQHSGQQMGMRRTTTLQNIRTSPKVDRTCYLEQASQLNEAFERLIKYGLSPRNERLLREKLLHLHERAHLPVPPFKRWRSVGKEVLNLHYHRFSNGWFSAAKDLLA